MRPLLILLLALPVVTFIHQQNVPQKDSVVLATAIHIQASEAPLPAKLVLQPTKPTKAPDAPIVPQTAPTTHEQLMAAAGISLADYGAAEYIVSRESGWDPNATEPNTGAHGLPQALPYSKTGCGWVDSICQLKWADNYAKTRYGGWWNAHHYWAIHRNW